MSVLPWGSQSVARSRTSPLRCAVGKYVVAPHGACTCVTSILLRRCVRILVAAAFSGPMMSPSLIGTRSSAPCILHPTTVGLCPVYSCVLDVPSGQAL